MSLVVTYTANVCTSGVGGESGLDVPRVSFSRALADATQLIALYPPCLSSGNPTNE